jgi:hypothetical protein
MLRPRLTRRSRCAGLLLLVGVSLYIQGSPALRGAPAVARASAALDLPAPKSYGETCSLVGSWCVTPNPYSSNRIPAALRRPLHLPQVRSGGRCPASAGRRIDNDQFAGIALGRGPIRPLIAASAISGGDLQHGVLPFGRVVGTSWRGVKTLWFSEPRYRGPVFIRGRQLGGSAKLVFGEGPSLIDPQLPPGPTLNGTNGWRQWPGGTYLRAFGCYAWQVDGTSFSTVIVFMAIKSRS